MNKHNTNEICPVCGFELGYKAWHSGLGSQEICPSCGIQFGYDDAAAGNVEKRGEIYKMWRAEWIKKGMQWQSKGPKPANWNPTAQLNKLNNAL